MKYASSYHREELDPRIERCMKLCDWIPAFAGMTTGEGEGLLKIQMPVFERDQREHDGFGVIARAMDYVVGQKADGAVFLF